MFLCVFVACLCCFVVVVVVVVRFLTYRPNEGPLPFACAVYYVRAFFFSPSFLFVFVDLPIFHFIRRMGLN